MNNKNETIEILLTNRIYLYNMFHIVFSGMPNNELLDILSSDATSEAFSLLSTEFDDTMSKFADFCADIAQKSAEDSLFIEHAKDEYAALFLGPAKLVAYPWESTYFGESPLLFQGRTLMVRFAYRKYGYLPQEYPKVADDHIAIELHFMAKLSEMVLDAFSKENWTEFKNILTDQKLFLNNHLTDWLPKYCENMKLARTRYLYPQFAVAVEEFTRIDKQLVTELLGELE